MRSALRIFRLVQTGAIAALWFAMPPAAGAEPALDGREIAWRSHSRPAYKLTEATALEMRLVNRRGEVRQRLFLRYQKQFPQGKTTLMKFWRPGDIANTGTLNVQTKGEDDKQYLYLPALQKLRRIASANHDQSWLGSDYIFEDLKELDFDAYRYERIEDGIVDGRECYRYLMKPANQESSTYSKQIRSVTKDRYLPVKIEYFDLEGRALKVFEATDLRPAQGEIYYAWKIKMHNVQDGHTTELQRLWLVLDAPMPDDCFTTSKLEQPIQGYSHPEDLWSRWQQSLPQ